MSSVVCEFDVSYDGLVKVVTGIIVVLMLVFFVWVSYLALGEDGLVGFTILSLLIAFFLLIVVFPYLFSPRRFILMVDGVLIKRCLRSILIPYSVVSGVRRVSWTWRAVRFGASGGLYGFFGLFYVQGLGRVWMYVTDRGKMVLIETRRGERYIVSPCDPQKFLDKLESLLSHHRVSKVFPP